MLGSLFLFLHFSEAIVREIDNPCNLISTKISAYSFCIFMILNLITESLEFLILEENMIA